jgi:hypothetical protein
MFWTPDPMARSKRLLAQEENKLLDAEAALENAMAIRNAHRTRVQRLRALCQPAPTAVRESVTVGDITPALSPSTAAPRVGVSINALINRRSVNG